MGHMDAFSETLFKKYGSRCTRKEKEAFLSFAPGGFWGAPFLEEHRFLGRSFRTLFFGDPRRCRLIVACRYDTPRMRFFPYAKYFTNTGMKILNALLVPGVLFLFCRMIARAAGLGLLFSLALFLPLLVFFTWVVPNRVNDNDTASLMVLHLLFKTAPPEVCFALADKGEFFDLGLHALKRAYPNTPVLEIELVGRGNKLLYFAPGEEGKPAGAIHIKTKKKFAISCAYENFFGYFMNNIKTPQDNHLSGEAMEAALSCAEEVIKRQ